MLGALDAGIFREDMPLPNNFTYSSGCTAIKTARFNAAYRLEMAQNWQIKAAKILSNLER